MRIRWFAAALLAFPACAQAHDFKIIGTTDQIRQIERSLSACPSLGKMLDSLKASGRLSQIRVTTTQETQQSGPFVAVIAKDDILLASDWLTQQEQPFADVHAPGDILPDNLCFGLGHLADHIAHPVSPVGNPTDFMAGVNKRLNAESLAFLRGWPYVIEAARANNGSKPLAPVQIGKLLVNLRYRFVFLAALREGAVPQLKILADGEIPDTDSNIEAITNVLKQAKLADLQ